ncbi:MAG: lipopolysaccharide heptosyltransferase II [Candidatus Omnitrophota bacterium]
MKKILIIRTDRLGDLLLSTPVFRAVREGYPDSHISVMVRPYTRECVEGNPYINEVIVYDKYGNHKSVLSSLRFAGSLRKKRFDMALILHPTNRVNLITFLAGIPKRVGFNRKFGFLLTHKVAHKKRTDERHELDYALDIVRAIGLTPRIKTLYMPIKRDVQRKIDSMLCGLGVRATDFVIAIHSSSSCVSKKWPQERFAGVADRLIDKYDAKIVFIGGEDAKDDTKKAMAAMKREAIDLSGRTTIPELAALLKRCEAFISNDSGPVHVACAVGTPVIAIFGRKDAGLGPKRWGPTGERDKILHKDVGCQECLAHNCTKGFLCLNAIDEDEVINETEYILYNRKRENRRVEEAVGS